MSIHCQNNFKTFSIYFQKFKGCALTIVKIKKQRKN